MSIIRSIPSGELLHRGGEAALYKVKCGSKLYTLKLYNSGTAYDQKAVEAVAKVAAGSIAGTKNTTGIYRIAEYGTIGENAYVLYDYIDGVSSKELSPMPLEFVLHSLRQAVAALMELQKAGISHGDISPDNVFFDRDGCPVLIDFGIRGPGTLKFSAPERIDGQVPSTQQSDQEFPGRRGTDRIGGEHGSRCVKVRSVRQQRHIEYAARFPDQQRPGEILFGKISSGLNIKPETLSLLEPIWKGTIATEPGSRAESLEELDELLEIALDSLGGQGVRLSRLAEGVREKISGILEKNGTKTLEKVDFPFFEEKKAKNPSLKRWILATAVFIFLVMAAACVFLASGKSPSVDDTGEALLQKSRSHEMELQDSVKMPNLEGVLKKLEPEESE